MPGVEKTLEEGQKVLLSHSASPHLQFGNLWSIMEESFQNGFGYKSDLSGEKCLIFLSPIIRTSSLQGNDTY